MPQSKTTPETFEQLWTSFRDHVYPNGAPQAQLDDMQRAFYSGAYGLFGHIMGGLPEGGGFTDADIDALDTLYRDIEDHLAKLVGVVH